MREQRETREPRVRKKVDYYEAEGFTDSSQFGDHLGGPVDAVKSYAGQEIQQYVLDYVATPEFTQEVVKRITDNPSTMDELRSKAITQAKPYLPTAIAAGLVMGFVGAWIYSWWSHRKPSKRFD